MIAQLRRARRNTCRSFTRLLSGWLVLTLLFAQVASAAYACPQGLASSAPVQQAMAEMPGCDGHMAAGLDDAQPSLCKAHCEQGAQSVNSVAASDVPAATTLWAVLDWAPLALVPVQAGHGQVLALSGAPPPGAPPLYIALLVLRN